MELMRESEREGILSPREWWLLSHLFEAMVIYDPDIISISVSNRETKKNITKELSEKLEMSGVSVTRTIDSFFIECGRDQILKVMLALEHLTDDINK